jgi:hypothetical protein
MKRAGYSFALGVFLLPPLAAAPLACERKSFPTFRRLHPKIWR